LLSGQGIALLRMRGARRRGLGGAGLGERVGRIDVGALAVADRRHAVAPRQQARVGQELVAAVDVAALEEPDDVIGGEIGDARRVAQEIGPPVLQHVGEPLDLRAHEMEVARGRLAHRVDRRQRQAVQAGAVLVQAGWHVVGIDARDEQRHRPHELVLGPPGDGLGGATGRGGKKRGVGHAALELAGHQARVAPQIGAVLQHRNAAIAAGQRCQVGLGQDRRLLDAAPGQALEAQHQAGLLGEVGEVVMMQNEVVHPWANFFKSSPARR
jgi:hypothetical protein